MCVKVFNRVRDDTVCAIFSLSKEAEELPTYGGRGYRRKFGEILKIPPQDIEMLLAVKCICY
jgi:hypothetical protein